MVYVPPGNYLISDTLDLYFYTHLVGNHLCQPTLTLKANSPGFDQGSTSGRCLEPHEFLFACCVLSLTRCGPGV